jgi:predicted transcriptional regulator
VRNTDPETSHQAAARAPSVRANDRRAALIAHVENPAGITDFELAEIVGRQQTSAGKRRGELRDLGLIEDSGLRRAAPSGSSSIVWRITMRGRIAVTR